MKLAIISHTEHYRNAQGRIVGWGPTVSELNHLATHFDEIYHVAMLHDSAPPPSSLPYLHDNITFVPLPPSGGRRGGTNTQAIGIRSIRPLVIACNVVF